MTFAAPDLLFALVAVPFAAIGYRMLERRRADSAANWSRRAMLPNIVRRPPRRLGFLPPALFLLGLSFMLVGFARPEWILGNATGGAPTVVLTIDVSGSMAATDVQPSRIRAAHAIAVQFLHELPPAYRVAVVTFGDTPRLALAPTTDHAKVIAALPTAVTPLAGTAIGDAVSYSIAVVVAAASDIQPGSLYRPGAILLLSDGGQTAGGTTPDEAAVSALVDYIPIDTVAIGTPGGIVTQTAKIGGTQTSNQIHVPFQAAVLHALSTQTKGAFFEAAAAARSPAELATVYRSLRSHSSPGHVTHALSADAAAVALAFVLGGILLSGLWFGRMA